MAKIDKNFFSLGEQRPKQTFLPTIKDSTIPTTLVVRCELSKPIRKNRIENNILLI
jgi:hypothetical protein